MKKLKTVKDKEGKIIEIYDYDISPKFVEKYGKDGALIYYKNFISNYSRSYEYDENGNEIHRKDSTGYEQWYDYDENGNEIHWKDSDGNEKSSEYDENGNKIHYKDSDGCEESYEYTYE